jgi:hypothetical protein
MGQVLKRVDSLVQRSEVRVPSDLSRVSASKMPRLTKLDGIPVAM